MIKKMQYKFDEILDREIIIDNKILSEDEVLAIEIRNNIKLPSEYFDFLTSYYEVYIKDNYHFPMIEKSKFTPRNGFETMDYFYSGNFEKNLQEFTNFDGNEIVPIGEASGDIICLGVQGDKSGKIYYLYHEDENDDKSFYFIANSFNEFILSFQKKEGEKNIDLDEIEIELDDDLWND